MEKLRGVVVVVVSFGRKIAIEAIVVGTVEVCKHLILHLF